MNQKTVPCRLCSQPTLMLGTKLCDRCWGIEHRVQSDPLIALRVLVGEPFFSKLLSAVVDARDYIEYVVDDRDESPIPSSRRDEVIELLSAIIKGFGR